MFRVSVPGSIMLFGEHAVLQGKMAVVAAIEARLQCTITPNDTNKINLMSSFGSCCLDLNDSINKEFNIPEWQFVIASIQYFNNIYKITRGFNLSIDGNSLKNSMGFGSSAAVVVGVLSVINKFFYHDISPENIFKQALSVVHKVQGGLGSGADLAASIYGGVIGFKNLVVHKIFPITLYLTAVYSGYKTKTAEVIKIVNNNMRNNETLYNKIFSDMDNCSNLAISAIEQKEISKLGKLMNVAHEFMKNLGVVDQKLDDLAYNLRKQSDIYGAKVSGAGLGDCVIGLGELKQKIFQEEQFLLETSVTGLIWL